MSMNQGQLNPSGPMWVTGEQMDRLANGQQLQSDGSLLCTRTAEGWMLQVVGGLNNYPFYPIFDGLDCYCPGKNVSYMNMWWLAKWHGVSVPVTPITLPAGVEGTLWMHTKMSGWNEYSLTINLTDLINVETDSFDLAGNYSRPIGRFTTSATKVTEYTHFCYETPMFPYKTGSFLYDPSTRKLKLSALAYETGNLAGMYAQWNQHGSLDAVFASDIVNTIPTGANAWVWGIGGTSPAIALSAVTDEYRKLAHIKTDVNGDLEHLYDYMRAY